MSNQTPPLPSSSAMPKVVRDHYQDTHNQMRPSSPPPPAYFAGREGMQQAVAAKDPHAPAQSVPPFEYALREQLIGHEEAILRDRDSGNATMHPINVFSQLDALAQVRIRIDDQLAHVARCAPGDESLECIDDLIRYLVYMKLMMQGVQ